MNYINLYNRLITSRFFMKEERMEQKGNGVYFEKHHITPKSKGGDNSYANIVLLTSREHYLAHWIIWLIYRDRSSALGFHKMVSMNKYQKRIISGRDYEKAREAFRLTNIGNTYGKAHKGRKQPTSPELILQRSLRMKNKFDAEKNPFFNKKHTEETKRNLSKKRKEYYKNNIPWNAKIVIDYNTGVYYTSIREAGSYSNYNPLYLKCMLNGKNINHSSFSIA